MKISWQAAINLETKIQQIIFEQIEYGVRFDSRLAKEHIIELDYRLNELYTKIRPLLSMEVNILEKTHTKNTTVSGIEFTKGDRDYVKKICLANGDATSSVSKHYGDNYAIVSGPFTRIEWSEPSLSKRERLSGQMLRLGWKPKAFSPTGRPQLTVDKEPVPSLLKISGTVGEDLSQWFTYNHRKSQIVGLLNNVRPDGRIPSAMDPLGTNTSRARHSKIVNIPHVGSLFGAEMRGLFTASEGYMMLGVDACALESRVAAHYTYPHDEGAYAERLLKGDPHQALADHLGITRLLAKRIGYAILYGSGVGKVAEVLSCSQKKAKEIYIEFWKFNHALSSVRNLCMKAHETRGWVKGIDSRKIYTRSSHSSMNALFQSCGSIIIKRSLVKIDNWIKSEQLDIHQLIFMHDEVQLDVEENLYETRSEDIATNIESCFTKAGEDLNLRIKIEAEVKYGRNWSETH